MSSLRPAKIVTALLHLIGGTLAERAEPDGPACPCEGCQRAWHALQSPDHLSPRAKATVSLRRLHSA
jgi:hypothetical protein